MSKDLSFREKLGRPAATRGGDQASSSSPVEIRIKRPSAFVHPVALAKLLRENGLRLAAAHDAVSRLANEHVVDLILRPSDYEGVLAKMRALGLEASVSTERHAAVF